MLVEAWLQRAALERPEQIALETPQDGISYAELLGVARAGATQLAGRGVGRGQHVAIALPAGLAFAQALHACLLLGAVAVPVDLRLSARERARVAQGAVAVVDEPLGAAAGRSRNPTVAVAPAALDPRDGALFEHDLDATAAVIHTSGTSSAPKPVQLTYGNLLWSALGSAVALGLDARERWLCALPLSHVGGLSILVRSAIYATTAIVHERFETDRVLDALREQDVTLVSLVATTLARLLDAGLSEPPALRCALTGGGPVPAALVRQAHAAGVPVSLTYGLTESCSQVTTTPAAALGGRNASSGPPLFCTRVRIEGRSGRGSSGGARAGAAEPAGHAGASGEGEILVAGPTVAPSAPGPDGWLRTGDLGTLDGNGALRVTGRKADTIVTGGENVAPSEVEAVLEAHPDVLEAAVVACSDPRWGEAVTAIVVGRPGRTPAGEELREHCARSLAPFKVPKRVLLREQSLPRTRSGKLLRRELG